MPYEHVVASPVRERAYYQSETRRQPRGVVKPPMILKHRRDELLPFGIGSSYTGRERRGKSEPVFRFEETRLVHQVKIGALREKIAAQL